METQTENQQPEQADYIPTPTEIANELNTILFHKKKAEEARERSEAVRYARSNLERAEAELAEAKTGLNQALDDYEENDTIARFEERIAELKEAAIHAYDPSYKKTHTGADGFGFQWRVSQKAVIEDEPAVAKALIENGLWESTGASLKLNNSKLKQATQTGFHLDGVAVQDIVSVAFVQPKEEQSVEESPAEGSTTEAN